MSVEDEGQGWFRSTGNFSSFSSPLLGLNHSQSSAQESMMLDNLFSIMGALEGAVQRNREETSLGRRYGQTELKVQERREPPSPADSHPGFMQGMKNPEIMARDISPFLKITRAQEEPVNHPGRKVVEAGIPCEQLLDHLSSCNEENL
ncbi:hypothetical protein H920_05638 [Fukomys damarensis]|uniref:Uncharacterized protein n=1 Tax=Fukomys damarensis TaxID=885580 RepID=A0A091DPL2_FUKDA|nr:hypothetical protein H920_05638 [Fukomys damarensis]